MYSMADLNLKMLWSPHALMMYAGAAIGFYGSRALHAFAITPLVKKVAGEGTGIKDPRNYAEATDVVTAAILLMVVKDEQMRMGILSGAGLSLIDHLITRFPAVSSKLPR
jgi:hypothetical protein